MANKISKIIKKKFKINTNNKIQPIVLCGGTGDRLWSNSQSHQAKQFIDFGNWTLLDKTLQRLKKPIFDIPIISTNLIHFKEIKKHLKKNKINKYKIILEPIKKNTGPAILAASLIKDIPYNKPLIFFSADHLIEKDHLLIKELKKKKAELSDQNIFLFGIKPENSSSQLGYFITKKIKKNLNKVVKFIEKPQEKKAKKIIKLGGYWNSGIFFARKDSIINNFKKFQTNIYKNTSLAVKKSKFKSNTYYLNKNSYIKNSSKSFDYAILEKIKDIYAIKLSISWSDLGSWKEICKMYDKLKNKYKKKKNIFHRPWGRYTNLFNGKNFLIKEMYIKPKGILSLQKHFHRAEHWLVTQGTPKITLNNKIFFLKSNETIFVPLGAIHRIENPYQKPVKIIEAQVGSILKETDIVRYKDVYGRVN